MQSQLFQLTSLPSTPPQKARVEDAQDPRLQVSGSVKSLTHKPAAGTFSEVFSTNREGRGSQNSSTFENDTVQSRSTADRRENPDSEMVEKKEVVLCHDDNLRGANKASEAENKSVSEKDVSTKPLQASLAATGKPQFAAHVARSNHEVSDQEQKAQTDETAKAAKVKHGQAIDPWQTAVLPSEHGKKAQANLSPPQVPISMQATQLPKLPPFGREPQSVQAQHDTAHHAADFPVSSPAKQPVNALLGNRNSGKDSELAQREIPEEIKEETALEAGSLIRKTREASLIDLPAFSHSGGETHVPASLPNARAEPEHFAQSNEGDKLDVPLPVHIETDGNTGLPAQIETSGRSSEPEQMVPALPIGAIGAFNERNDFLRANELTAPALAQPQQVPVDAKENAQFLQSGATDQARNLWPESVKGANISKGASTQTDPQEVPASSTQPPASRGSRFAQPQNLVPETSPHYRAFSAVSLAQNAGGADLSRGQNEPLSLNAQSGAPAPTTPIQAMAGPNSASTVQYPLSSAANSTTSATQVATEVINSKPHSGSPAATTLEGPPAPQAEPRHLAAHVARPSQSDQSGLQMQSDRTRDACGGSAELQPIQSAPTQQKMAQQIFTRSAPPVLTNANRQMVSSLNAEGGDGKTKELTQLDPVTGDVRAAQSGTVSTTNAPATRAELPAHIVRQLFEIVQQMPNRPVEIALKPQELGSVRLMVQQVETGIVVNLTAERPETLDLLRRHIDQLGQDFKDLGYSQIAFSFAGSDPEPQSESNENEPAVLVRSGAETSVEEQTEATQIHLDSGTCNGVDLRL